VTGRTATPDVNGGAACPKNGLCACVKRLEALITPGIGMFCTQLQPRIDPGRTRPFAGSAPGSYCIIAW